MADRGAPAKVNALLFDSHVHTGMSEARGGGTEAEKLEKSKS